MDDADGAGADAFERVVERVRDRVDPSPGERARLAAVASRVVERAREAAADLPVADVDVVQVGSTARGTWTSGDRDVDVFVRFPPDLPREDLERYGLTVGRAVLPDGEEAYAEHPYVAGELDGFAVDLVPCYRVESATEIRSAVDRTPFHTAYLEARLDADLAGEVRLAKGFLKAIGTYGSDLRTRGFSGYLTELLVVEYGDFRAFCEAVAGWHPPVDLDPEGHGTCEFDDPLVVVDPTDPERNVAAVLGATNVARTIHHARDLLDEPRVEVFDPHEPAPVSRDDVRAHVDRRGTTPVAVRVRVPDLVDDQLYPQLEKSLSGVRAALERNGFDVLRAAAFAAGRPGDAGGGGGTDDRPVALLWECEVVERPRIERHEGPPVHVGEHARGFYEKYVGTKGDGEQVYGPFVDGERYVVEREREYATAVDLLSEGLFGASLGARVEEALRDDYEILVGDEVAVLADRFGTELAAYFDPQP